MGPRQHANFDADRPDGIGVAAVNPLAPVEHLRAHDPVLDFVELRRDVPDPFRELVAELRQHVLLELLDGAGAAGLVLGVDGLGHGLLAQRPHPVEQGGVRARRLPGHLGTSRGIDDPLLQRDQVADALLGDLERLQHLRLAHLERAALHHVDSVSGAGDHQVDAGELELLERGVEDPLSVHPPDADRCERPIPGNRGNAERDRRRHRGEHVGIVLLVGREHGGEDLDLVLEPLRKQRSDAAVDETAGQNFLVRRPAFPFEKTAGDFAGGVGLLPVLDGERKERERADVRWDGYGGEDDGIAELHQCGAGGLLGEAARLDDEAAAGKLGFNPMYGHDAFPMRAHECSEGVPMCSFGTPSRTRCRQA